MVLGKQIARRSSRDVALEHTPQLMHKNVDKQRMLNDRATTVGWSSYATPAGSNTMWLMASVRDCCGANFEKSRRRSCGELRKLKRK